MSPSIWQILIVAALILVFFGRGRISEVMGDFGKGIKSFKKGLNEVDDEAKAETPPKQIEDKSGTAGTANLRSHDRSAG